MNEKGIILFGEAAKEFVTYKYVELGVIVFLLLFIVGMVGYIAYKIISDDR